MDAGTFNTLDIWIRSSGVGFCLPNSMFLILVRPASSLVLNAFAPNCPWFIPIRFLSN
jgi:hypothetical protein